MFGRHNRFNSRLEIERKVLRIVNRSYCKINPLEGLTEASLNKWNSQGTINPVHFRLLSNIAKLSSLHNDCSKDIFSGEEALTKDNLAKSIDELQNRFTIYVAETARHKMIKPDKLPALQSMLCSPII